MSIGGTIELPAGKDRGAPGGKRQRGSALLLVDGVVNLALGAGLLLFPRALPALVGAPLPATGFYPSILGAVLLGIGAALFLERGRPDRAAAGLGLGGAIVINFCGGGALLAWLLFAGVDVAARGWWVLGALAALVLGVAMAEVLARPWRGSVAR